MFLNLLSCSARLSLGVFSPLALVGIALVSCSAPPPSPLVEGELRASLELRAQVEATEAALDLLPLASLQIEVDAEAEPSEAAFWRARARAWSFEVRSALQAFRRRSQLQDAAGLPGPIVLAGEVEELEDPERAAILRASVDVLGIFGLGPRAAAAELADAETRAALGRLERALWAARFDAERALVRLAATRARVAELRKLVEETRDDRTRLEVYASREWLAAGPSETAIALIARAAQRFEVERSREHTAVEALARRSGLLTSDAAISAVSPRLLEVYDASIRQPRGTAERALLTLHPEARSAALEYAVAEAQLRRAASEAWPGLRIGPRARVEPTNLLGAFVELRLPWPGQVDAETRAALEARKAARIAVEERVRALMGRERESSGRVDKALLAIPSARTLSSRSKSAWTAAQARWSVDTTALMMFNDALERRIGACVAAIDALELAALSWLDWCQAAGPEARS